MALLAQYSVAMTISRTRGHETLYHHRYQAVVRESHVSTLSSHGTLESKDVIIPTRSHNACQMDTLHTRGSVKVPPPVRFILDR